jgi:hypothetical protein
MSALRDKQIPLALRTGQIGQAAGALARTLGPDELAAVAALVRQEAGGYTPTLDRAVAAGRLTPAEAAAVHDAVFETNPNVAANKQIGPAGGRLAVAYQAGSLPEGQVARLAAGQDIVRNHLVARQQAIEVAGANRLGPGRPCPTPSWGTGRCPLRRRNGSPHTRRR